VQVPDAPLEGLLHGVIARLGDGNAKVNIKALVVGGWWGSSAAAGNVASLSGVTYSSYGMVQAATGHTTHRSMAQT
jgi:hypothetical protein